jgi:hypothetical protein
MQRNFISVQHTWREEHFDLKESLETIKKDMEDMEEKKVE